MVATQEVPQAKGALPPDAAGEREQPRVTVLVRTVKLIADERELVGVLLDVSRGGVQVKLFKHLPSGAALALELENGERLPLELVWQRGDHAGLRFAAPVDVAAVMQTGDGINPHRQIRLRFCKDGEIIASGVSHPMRFANVSQCGACCECETHLAIGQLVQLETDGLAPHYATVRWRRRPSYGLVFEDLLNMGQLAGLIAPDLPDAAGAEPAAD